MLQLVHLFFYISGCHFASHLLQGTRWWPLFQAQNSLTRNLPKRSWSWYSLVLHNQKSTEWVCLEIGAQTKTAVDDHFPSKVAIGWVMSSVWTDPHYIAACIPLHLHNIPIMVGYLYNLIQVQYPASTCKYPILKSCKSWRSSWSSHGPPWPVPPSIATAAGHGAWEL